MLMSLPVPNSSPPQKSCSEAGNQALSEPEFSPEEQAQLLQIAHQSIASALESREIFLEPPSAHLAEPRGVFTTLHVAGNLRGCVGYVRADSPVYRAVGETARAAAFEDNRFPPVTREEAPLLEIELSILSPPLPIPPDAIQVGRHGLFISQHGRRGLLLPQVAVEHQWDRETFLEQTCRKAGLPPDAWRNGASVEAFTAQIFRDQPLSANPLDPSTSLH
jgi:uncharacterized protein